MDELRPAAPTDHDAVARLLLAAYGTLLAPDYDQAVLDRALPGLTRPNAVLLSSGRFWLAVDDSDAVVGCGGWSFEAPGHDNEPAPSGATLAHLRHFAVSPDSARRGVGRAVLARCLSEAARAGATHAEALSTLGAVPFYTAAGLERVESLNVPIDGLPFPAVRMRGPVR